MQYGHFDDDAREYVIDRPDTPRSWSNYLGSTEYGAVITNNAGGFSFYRSGAQGRFMRMWLNSIPMDQPGRYIYLRDNDNGDYWSASWQPVGKPLDSYKSTCRHGTAYTIIESEYDNVRSETTYFVPLDRNFEIWAVKLTNTGDTPRNLSAITYVEYNTVWDIRHDYFNLQYTQYTTKMEFVDDMIQHGVVTLAPPDPDDFQNMDQGRYSFQGLVGAEVAGFEADREAFLGPYRTYANPLAVETGEMKGSLADGDNGCGSLKTDIVLQPGETREFLVVVGVGRPDVEGRAAVAEFATPAKAYPALEEVKALWHGRLGNLVCKTPDTEFNSMINVWNAYNALITFTWSRAASLIYTGDRDGLGYRDSVQDMVGAAALIPDMVRERLELLITGQCASGGAMPVVKPFAHRPGHESPPAEDRYRADDCLWLFNAVPEYVKESGDMGFFEKVLPYADSGEDTVLGHLKRALCFNLERTGEHGLPCGLLADWNDCLRLGQRGESVFVAFQLRYGLAVYIDVCGRLGKPEEAEWAREQLERLDALLQEHCWDGEWFVRAFRDDGSIIGTVEDDEGSIFLNAQSWAVLSGAARGEQAETAMQSVKDRLATEYGIMVCTPPFSIKTDYHVVRACVINQGMKENGGIFCHTQGWAVMAEALLGHCDRAYEYYRAYMPAAYNTRAEVREIEPYVHCQSTHSRFSRRFGASRIPWLSGTVAWSYYAGTHAILGIQPDYEGLRIDPCLPSGWDAIDVERTFRGARFNIHVVNNGAGKGVSRMVVNGREVEGNLVPAEMFEDVNEVEVTLG